MLRKTGLSSCFAFSKASAPGKPIHRKAYGVKGATLPLLGRIQEAIDAFRQCIRINDNPTLVDIAKKSIIELGGTP